MISNLVYNVPDYRDAPIPDTYIDIGHFWRDRVGIGYSVSIRYHNRYYYDII